MAKSKEKWLDIVIEEEEWTDDEEWIESEEEAEEYADTLLQEYKQKEKESKFIKYVRFPSVSDVASARLREVSLMNMSEVANTMTNEINIHKYEWKHFFPLSFPHTF